MPKVSKKNIYLNNPNLPTVDAQFEYTPEMVAEIKECGDNVLHFAEHYFHIISVDEGKQKIKLHVYQKRALRMMRDNRFSLLLFSRQTGKALALDTPVPTPNGWTTMGDLKEGDMIYSSDGKPCRVTHAHEVLHNRECYEVLFDNGETIVADAEHLWFTQTLRDSKVRTTKEIYNTLHDQHIIPHCDRFSSKQHTITNIQPTLSVPVRCITVDSVDHQFLVGKQYIPTHNSTISTIFCLWTACFNKDQNILIVANKESTAKEIFKRVRLAYEELPNWLKPGVKEYGKESMELANGSRIGIATTTGTAGRGSSANLLFIDEADWIEPHLLDDFWASVYPIISSSKKSKIIMASTPRDTSGLFYKLYKGSAEGENSWANMKIIWSEVPGRDEKWKRETMGSLSDPSVFFREFECQFEETGESVTSAALYDRLKRRVSEPLHIYMDGAYKLWDTPKPDRLYVVGVDVSEGVSKDFTIVTVLDITDLKLINQVAVYASNTITPTEFTPRLNEILQHWGRPLVLVERNNCGAQVVDNLRKDFQYENIVSHGAREIGKTKIPLGVICHTNSKYDCVLNQRYWISTLDAVQINDAQTVEELKDFIRYPNGSWKARIGKNDDRVMSLFWGLFILFDKLVYKHFEVVSLDENHKPLMLRPLDFGLKYFQNPSSMYVDERNGDGLDALPVSFGSDSQHHDIDDLRNQGWEFLQ